MRLATPLPYRSLNEIRRDLGPECFEDLLDGLRFAADQLRARMATTHGWDLTIGTAREFVRQMYLAGEIYLFEDEAGMHVGVWDGHAGCWRSEDPEHRVYPMETESVGPFL